MWRRGRKLGREREREREGNITHCICLSGEGQFGKVYECINLDKGEVHAVKMVT